MSLSREFGEGLHQRLLGGDPIASSELVLAYLDPLIRRLGRRFPTIADITIIHDAVTDALLQYVQFPQRFNPAKASLDGYLSMAARGDLLNALRKERRRMTRQVRLESVAERELRGNSLVERDNEDASSEALVSASQLMRRLQREISDPRDREVLQLMLEGERKTARFANALAIHNLSEGEQRRIVKRCKDRLTKRLQRLGVKLREESRT
jgi:RNA polymerase sigma-70 factor (ECF subfamily)